jgi:hypothetical protein
VPLDHALHHLQHRPDELGLRGHTELSCEFRYCGALSRGSIRATARSLKACPYRAMFVPHHRPRMIDSYRGDNNSYAEGAGGVSRGPGCHSRGRRRTPPR